MILNDFRQDAREPRGLGIIFENTWTGDPSADEDSDFEDEQRGPERDSSIPLLAKPVRNTPLFIEGSSSKPLLVEVTDSTASQCST
jgi:hypothetical protein